MCIWLRVELFQLCSTLSLLISLIHCKIIFIIEIEAMEVFKLIEIQIGFFISSSTSTTTNNITPHAFIQLYFNAFMWTSSVLYCIVGHSVDFNSDNWCLHSGWLSAVESPLNFLYSSFLTTHNKIFSMTMQFSINLCCISKMKKEGE